MLILPSLCAIGIIVLLYVGKITLMIPLSTVFFGSFLNSKPCHFCGARQYRFLSAILFFSHVFMFSGRRLLAEPIAFLHCL